MVKKKPAKVTVHQHLTKRFERNCEQLYYLGNTQEAQDELYDLAGLFPSESDVAKKFTEILKICAQIDKFIEKNKGKIF